MATNFPEVWEDRFIQNLNSANEAPWLDGIAELSADVQVINAGDITEKNTIHVAASDFEVDVLVNNTTYPIAVQQYTDGTLSFNLDKFQTKVTTLKDDDVMGASYSKIDVVTAGHQRGILVEKYQRAIHALAPSNNLTKTPIILATGGPDALKDPSGRFRLTYEDLVEAKRRCKGFVNPRLVLNEDHWNDLLLDRKNFGDQLVNYKEGNPAPRIAGFDLYQYQGEMPLFDIANLTKKAYGAVQTPTEAVASVIFAPSGVAKKTGMTKQYYAPAHSNPYGQTNDIAYRHYFMALPFRAEKIGAVISPIDPSAITPTNVTVTPSTESTGNNTTVQFAASVSPGGAVQDVNWTIDTAADLSIDQDGLVTIGDTTPAAPYTVTATAVGHPSVSGTATLTVA